MRRVIDVGRGADVWHVGVGSWRQGAGACEVVQVRAKQCGSNEAVQVHGMVRVSVRRCRCSGSDGAENVMRKLFEERLSVFYSVSHLVR